MQKPARICDLQTIRSDARCEGCIVRSTLHNGSVPMADLQNALSRSECTTVSPKRSIYAQGAPGEAVFQLRRGSLKLRRRDASGTVRLVRLAKAGQSVGLESLLGSPYRHTAVALEPLEFCRIPLAVFRYLEAAGRAFYAELLGRWQANLEDTEDFWARLGSGVGEQRLARLLLILREMRSGASCVPLLRRDIGDALGVSMETASRLMADFRRRGLIKGKGGSFVCEEAGLRDLAGL
jgi:CRP/FNR family transcriptional regulator